MRYAHDHPRSWLELVALLSHVDACALRHFASNHGIAIEQADPTTVEDVLTEWCNAGCVRPKTPTES
jgi:hypothetical protein